MHYNLPTNTTTTTTTTTLLLLLQSKISLKKVRLLPFLISRRVDGVEQLAASSLPCQSKKTILWRPHERSRVKCTVFYGVLSTYFDRRLENLTLKEPDNSDNSETCGLIFKIAVKLNWAYISYFGFYHCMPMPPPKYKILTASFSMAT
jgi:hypothetical protein